MVKEKTGTKDDMNKVNAKMSALEQENILLRQKLEENEKLSQTSPVVLSDSLMSEMKKIRQRGRVKGQAINVISKSDFKRISLWTKYGKQLGPMHPDNAMQTLNRFADLGVILTVDKPTPEQIEKYKQTPEYKKKLKWETERRAIKDKSRKSGQFDRLSAEIAKMSNSTIDMVNKILPMAEVKK